MGIPWPHLSPDPDFAHIAWLCLAICKLTCIFSAKVIDYTHNEILHAVVCPERRCLGA